MDSSLFADLISSSYPQPPLPAGPSASEIYSQMLLVLVTCVVGLLIIGFLWPSSKPFAQLELLWSVAPREAERERIWRLILPPEALDFGEAEGLAG